MNRLAKLYAEKAQYKAERETYAQEMRQIRAELDAMPDRVKIGSREHKRAEQLHERTKVLQRQVDTVEREMVRLDGEEARLLALRKAEEETLRRLESYIAPGGDLPRKLAAIEAERVSVLAEIEAYKTQKIPQQRKRLIEDFGWPDELERSHGD